MSSSPEPHRPAPISPSATTDQLRHMSSSLAPPTQRPHRRTSSTWAPPTPGSGLRVRFPPGPHSFTCFDLALS
ncbi:hypothetical protein DFP72DRAFT_1080276 [Ephemerocybe angulata]|uniref:Uncharacterized protein n=1 Tax=Ephemerocybe angulata TaxID=980116 RepID=A0A8H6LUN6_9AGAR|nr:hypothetical protein DFP72DRAFT_1080276 [Tulosesus angulatus]